MSDLLSNRLWAYATTATELIGATHGEFKVPVVEARSGLEADARAFALALSQPGPAQIAPGVTMSSDTDPLRLKMLSGYLATRNRDMTALLDETVRRRDAPSMLKAVVKMSDVSLENELLSKVIGKTVSGIDQLTKLS